MIRYGRRYFTLECFTYSLDDCLAPCTSPQARAIGCSLTTTDMGWLWGSKKPSDSDPLRDLDPSLREFLSKESPVKYTPAPAPPAPPQETTTAAETTTAPAIDETKPLVPPESLYPDGRFAHLWSTYRPLAVIEAETKSDQEKLQDIFEGYKDRKAAIGRAAVENCVLEQIAMNDCFDKGRWADKMTMCRAENRVFQRCYTTQSVGSYTCP